MSKGRLFVGLDIGSANIRVVVAEEAFEDTLLRVIGVGETPSMGVRRGTIVDTQAVARACHVALEHAERMSGHVSERVFAALSGADIICQEARGVVAVSRADGEVGEDDVTRCLGEVEARLSLPLNREIIHALPKSYRLDDQKDIKDPVGMRGVRLEATALVVTGSTAQMKNIGRALEQAGTHAESLVVEPLAAAEAVLHQKQKELGVVLVNIGGSTTSITVYEDGNLLHLAVLPVGSGHITNDLAIGLRTSIDVAEAVKLQYGTANPDEVGKREEIDLSLFDTHEEDAVSRYHVAEIIEARMEEIFSFVNMELKTIGRDGLLPGGVVLTGGGALLPGTADLAKRLLRLPAQIGYPKPLGGILDQVDAPQFATVIGLVLLAEGSILEGRGKLQGWMSGVWVFEWMHQTWENIQKFARRFLP